MCRSKSEGGRRCGAGTTGGSGSADVGSATVGRLSLATTPEGKAAESRFYALRESGYAGWIDSGGYAVTDREHDAWVAEQPEAARKRLFGSAYRTPDQLAREDYARTGGLRPPKEG
jgi:hypothetical protein